MTYEVEHLFICLFTICVSSLVRCLLKALAYFLNQVFVFLLLSVKSSLYILDNGPFLDASFINIFSQSVAYLLLILIVSFAEQFLILMKCSLSIISFMDCAFGIVSKKSSPEPKLP